MTYISGLKEVHLIVFYWDDHTFFDEAVGEHDIVFSKVIYLFDLWKNNIISTMLSILANELCFHHSPYTALRMKGAH